MTDTDATREALTAAEAPRPVRPVRRGFVPLMTRWNDAMDRWGPKNPALRFVVDLVPWLAIALVLALLLALSR